MKFASRIKQLCEELPQLKFADLYNIRRIQTSYIPTNTKICIFTVQRLYTMLLGEIYEDALEKIAQEIKSDAEQYFTPRQDFTRHYLAEIRRRHSRLFLAGTDVAYGRKKREHSKGDEGIKKYNW